MRVETKTDEMFDQIFDITKASFDDIECPPAFFLKQEFNRGTIFVMTEPPPSQTIIAYAILGEKNGEPYIWSIATREKYRGRGCAGLLLDEIENFVKYILKDATGIGLMTNVNNPAQKLYFDKGYRILKHQPNYYGSGINGLYMRRPICLVP